MKVIVKTFTTKKFDADIKSWSNQKVAKTLNRIISPKNADEVIKSLDPNQIHEIELILGSKPKLPAKFKEIYQQFKSVKLTNKPTPKATEKDLKFYKATYKRNLKGRPTDYGCICYFENGKFTTTVSKSYLGDNDTSITEVKKNPGFDAKSILDFINSLTFDELELRIQFNEYGDYDKPRVIIDGKWNDKATKDLQSILGI